MDLQKEFPGKTLFWKYMIVVLQAMEQEYELYERLAKDRRFDMSRHLKKTVERYDWEQVNGDLSRAIACSSREHNAFLRKPELMVRRSRALINPDKESRQYRKDLEYLKNTDENKGWYYEER